ncbi:hypothetical protein GGF46_000862 [Coemansia sp. RSA 552]|nr:hypothetical protein GGF46_000862 [Coemansia sp. RSA 552]
MSGSPRSKSPEIEDAPSLTGEDSGTAAAPAPQEQQEPEQAGDGEETENMFDQLVALNMDRESAQPTSPLKLSHTPIFRKGTLIEIPEVAPKASHRRRPSRGQAPAPHPRLVAVCIKGDAQAALVIDWVLRNELVSDRDRIVLINVRQAANGIIGDLTLTNSTKDDAERTRSHELLRRHAVVIKQEGYAIKGVSIRGVDVRGELVRKLIELRCDLAIIGNHASKTMRERLTGSKVAYLVQYSPCPVLVVGSGMQRCSIPDEAQDAAASSQPNERPAQA